MPLRHHHHLIKTNTTSPTSLVLPIFVEYVVASVVLITSFVATFTVVHLRLRSARQARAFTTPLWPVRLLLPFFASIWALAHLLRPVLSCRAALLSSQAVAEPAFLALLFFLVNASIHRLKDSPLCAVANFGLALLTAAISAGPLLALHGLVNYAAPYAIFYLDVPPEVFGPEFSGDEECTYPFFATALLAVLGAAYVPLFMGAALGAAAVVINKRLRARIYALAAVVLGALSVQVVALALSVLWDPNDEEFQWLSVAAIAAFATLAAVSEFVLIVRPVVDALAVGRAEETSDDGDVTCIVRVRDDEENDECNG